MKKVSLDARSHHKVREQEKERGMRDGVERESLGIGREEELKPGAQIGPKLRVRRG